MSPKPTKERVCRKKERRAAKLLEAVSVLVAIQRGEKLALTLKEANTNWHMARDKYFEHLREHGC